MNKKEYNQRDSLIGSHSKGCSRSNWLAEIRPSVYKCMEKCTESTGCTSLTPYSEEYKLEYFLIYYS